MNTPVPGAVQAHQAARLQPTFVLLFAVTPAAGGAALATPAGLQPIPEDVAAGYRERIDERQQRLLGEPYLQARRLQRRSIGRLPLPATASDGDPATDPAWADIHLVVHKSGAAVWEVWLAAPTQPLDAARWTAWLDMEAPASLARRIWGCLSAGGGAAAHTPEMTLPLMVLRWPEGSLDELVAAHAHELVKLLHRDTSPQRFKPRFVADELAGDFCRRAQGLSLLARHGALDVHARDPQEGDAPEDHADDGPLPRNTLPLLVTLELLCLERAVLRGFLDRFGGGVVGSIDELVALRRDIFDGLEEYYGTLAKTHGYTAEATARGEKLFGIHDLFDLVTDRLESLTFEITTRNQQTVSRLGFWLTTSFGAIETGFVAASIATWYYATDLSAVLAWTFGTTLATALGIAALLRATMKR
jgi:hypothetical protein